METPKWEIPSTLEFHLPSVVGKQHAGVGVGGGVMFSIDETRKLRPRDVK